MRDNPFYAIGYLPGYSRTADPAVELPGPSTRAGSPHYEATQVQRQAGGGTYAAERRIGYKAMRRAGLSPDEARAIIDRADGYFRSIGVTPSTSTRIETYSQDANRNAVAVDVPLWTAEEGRSDLTLSLTATKDGERYVVQVDDLHVL